jgi:hypothetical protein
MDPDGHSRLSIAGVFCVFEIYPKTAIVPASMARKNTAGSREQTGNAY